ncbi:GntR family transcriptional regulator [Cryobacterium algoritolerans]|uniref:GntR family transcriptional regulator n=1 Tax=Cryobacterium algoritolerans TaxID=1259184 RepID=A0A4V3IF81_9MICO|nr:GntR family transcriptional regulator [Cryobacterium algoritolerans]TFC18156.1 GntR family transcriptional regulator [Cryobacterium algoritolerans]
MMTVSTDSATVGLSKAQLAHQWIRSRISDGTFSPGYRLVLGQIARELDVSAVPVREAIRLLEAEGLVTFERNIGAQVAMLDATEYVHTMQTLSLVEGYATALAAPVLNADTLERARRINAEMADCLDHFDPASFTRLNLEFHSTLFEACPNPHLLDLVHRGWSRLSALRDSIFSFVPGRAHESVAEHTALLDLIEDGGDPLQVELAARNHRLGTLDAFLARQKAPSP